MITKMSASSMNAKTWYRSMLAGNSAFDPGSYDLISSTILGSDTASVTFDTSGLSAYKHLQIRIAARSVRSAANFDTLSLQFNNVTSGAYAWHELSGAGSSVASDASYGADYIKTGYFPATSSDTNAFNVSVIDILDFGSTSKNTTIRSMNGFYGYSSSKWMQLIGGLWNNTAAVTSIKLYGLSASIKTGSRFSLYGVKG